MNNNETQVIGLGMIALGFILAIALVVHVLNRPRNSRVTNTPEDAQRILNHFLKGYTGENDLSDSMPVNALSSGKSLPVREFIFLSGDSLIVKASSEEMAWTKFRADCDDEDCPCGRPQESEVDDPDDEYCDCIESNETLTWVQEV